MQPPIRVALVSDYPIVKAGLASMLATHSHRVLVVDASDPAGEGLVPDVVLLDSDPLNSGALGRLRASWPATTHVVLFTGNPSPQIASHAIAAGASGVVLKTLQADELAAAVERVSRDQYVGPLVHALDTTVLPQTAGGWWSGKDHGLSYREAQMVALIASGYTNQEISQRLYLSPNSTKSYIRNAYAKIGVRHRSEAVIWGIAQHMVEPVSHPA